MVNKFEFAGELGFEAGVEQTDADILARHGRRRKIRRGGSSETGRWKTGKEEIRTALKIIHNVADHHQRSPSLVSLLCHYTGYCSTEYTLVREDDEQT